MRAHAKAITSHDALHSFGVSEAVGERIEFFNSLRCFGCEPLLDGFPEAFGA